MREIFNPSNSNNLRGHYPLLLGEDLGFHDNINVTYPKIAKVRDELKANNWVWDEIKLKQDARDILNPALAPSVDVMIKTLSFQMAGDAIASRSVQDILGLFCSNNELDGLLKYWAWNEYVHGMTYSEIVRAAFRNSQEVFESIKSDMHVLKRAKSVAKVFKETYELGLRYKLGENIPREVLMRAILRYLVVLYALETISFGASFASTFALVDSTKSFVGIGSNVQLIAKDELKHSFAGKTILMILLKDIEWRKVYASILLEVKYLLDEVMTLEFSWGPYLFSEGRQILGLNSKLLANYTTHLAAPVYDFLEIKMEYQAPSSNPLPWMDDWLDMDKSQKAAQEEQLVNYKVNSVVDDLGSDVLTF
jgi:ribonucleoside-diphosphate reductase beta chain